MHYEIEQAAEKDPKTFLDSVRRKYEGGSSETQYTYIFRKLLQNDFPKTLKNAIKKEPEYFLNNYFNDKLAKTIDNYNKNEMDIINENNKYLIDIGDLVRTANEAKKESK